MKKLTDAQIKTKVQEFVQSEYTGETPIMNMNEWLGEFVETVKREIEAGKTLQQAMSDSEDEMSGYISDDRSEPAATVFYSDEEDYPKTIGTYHDDTEGDFEVKWVSTDAWRGYYDIVPSKDWELVHTDTALSYSHDEAELKQFDDTLQKMLNKFGIKYARVFSRSSNVFSTGYDFFVEKAKATQVKGLVKLLAVKFRDPERFRFTAMTGADPSEATADDKLFVKYAGQLMAGKKSLKQIKKELEGRK